LTRRLRVRQLLAGFKILAWFLLGSLGGVDVALPREARTIMAVKSSKREDPSSSKPRQPAALGRVAEQAIREVGQVSRLLADENRLRILFYLVENGELHVTDLCDRLRQSQPAVSHHLALLRVSGLIEARREGKHNFYSLRSEAFGDLLTTLLSSLGETPKKLKFHDFTLTYNGNGNGR